VRPVAANVAAMLPTHDGSFRFFRFAGIQVYVHWSWFIVAVIEISVRSRNYTVPVWNAAEYLALFLIVLLHEFGHAFACRQTGGKADQIILWPLGGVAFVQPPPRPGAELWSIAAGPLVNVVLAPVLFGLAYFARAQGWTADNPDLRLFLNDVFRINLLLLVFNLLPIYPLDGGQILRSLLWFGVGKARSLQVAAIIGFVGVAGLVGLAVWWESLWTGIMALFIGQRCFEGYKHAQGLFALAKIPRHTGVACPECKERPPGGPLWACGQCGNRFDPFSTRAVCPHCGTVQPVVPCVHCGTASPIERWETVPRAGRGAPPVIDV
jgi:Zn-dependent protease